MEVGSLRMSQAYLYHNTVPKSISNHELLSGLEHEPLGTVLNGKLSFGEITLKETSYHSSFFKVPSSCTHIFCSVQVKTKLPRVFLDVRCGAENFSVIGQDVTAGMVYLPARIRLSRCINV